MKARRLSKVMNVSELVSDGDGSLSRSMLIKTYNTLMKERIWLDRVASEIVFQPFHLDSGTPLHDARVLQLERNRIYQLMSQTEFGHIGTFLTY